MSSDEDGRIHLDVCYHYGGLGYILGWFLYLPLFIQIGVSALAFFYNRDLAFFLVYNLGTTQTWALAKVFANALQVPRPAFAAACDDSYALPDAQVVYSLMTLLFLVYLAVVGRTRIGLVSAAWFAGIALVFCVSVVVNEFLSWEQLCMASGYALVHAAAWGYLFYMVIEPISHGLVRTKWAGRLGFNELISAP